MSKSADLATRPVADRTESGPPRRLDRETSSSSSLLATVLYQLLGLPLGVLYVTVVLTGVALSIGLMPLALLGIPTTIGLWHVNRALMRLERRLAVELLGAEIGPVQPVPRPPGGLWTRFKATVGDPYGWKAIGYLLLRFPAGIVTFTTTVTLTALSLGLTLAPTYMWTGDNREWLGRWFDSYLWSFALVPIGMVTGVASIGLVRLLGKACRGWTTAALRAPIAERASSADSPRPDRTFTHTATTKETS